jgi:hypothetical protein
MLIDQILADPILRYDQQRSNAVQRGIAFRLTFEEWWTIWDRSGHWHERGVGLGKYCMSRKGDKGAYEIGNVRICLFEDNIAEAGAMLSQPKSAATKTKMSVAQSNRSPEHLAKLAIAVDKRAKDTDYYRAVGRQLAEAKQRLKGEPPGTWPVYVRNHFGLSRERADALIRVANGTTTVEELRERVLVSTRKRMAREATT